MKTLLAVGFCAMFGVCVLAGCGGGGAALNMLTPPPGSPPPTGSPSPPPNHVYLWEANGSANGQWIAAYAMPISTNSSEIRRIADGGFQNTMAFDPNHRLFVTQNDTLQVFTQPILLGSCCTWFNLQTGEGFTQDVKIDSLGDAFVSGTTRGLCFEGHCIPNDAMINVFSAPITSSSTVSFSISVGSKVRSVTRPVGIALDGSGNLWAGTNATMFEYTRPFSGASMPVLQFPIGFDPSDIAFDSAGTMYAAGPGVVAYRPPFTASTTSAFMINTNASARFLAFDATGKLYVTTVTTGSPLFNTAKLLVFAPPFNSKSVPVVTLTLSGANNVEGIAIGP